jgi:L-asparaginase
VLEFEELLDSSDMGPEDWLKIASTIHKHYYDYDGFVCIHGTDTMAYTASALSFMFTNLGKPVILVGSMLPFGEVHPPFTINFIITAPPPPLIPSLSSLALRFTATPGGIYLCRS